METGPEQSSFPPSATVITSVAWPLTTACSNSFVSFGRAREAVQVYTTVDSPLQLEPIKWGGHLGLPPAKALEKSEGSLRFACDCLGAQVLGAGC